MFAYLRGKIINIKATSVVLEVNNIGYRVFMPQRMLGQLNLGSETLLHTYLQVREDDLSLYGFIDADTLDLFETLLTVSGVGPKLAVSIVNTVSADVFCRAIMNNELTVLTTIPGIGKKTAQRLVLELKDKLAAMAETLAFSSAGAAQAPDGVQAQVLDALTALGYREQEAAGAIRAATEQASQPLQDEASLLREALKYLGSSSR